MNLKQYLPHGKVVNIKRVKHVGACLTPRKSSGNIRCYGFCFTAGPRDGMMLCLQLLLDTPSRMFYRCLKLQT